MTTTWTIAVKLGASPDLAPIHEITVEAPDAPTALRRVAAMVEVQNAADAELLIDGQEEVFPAPRSRRAWKSTRPTLKAS